jgi:hypothetical protein
MIVALLSLLAALPNLDSLSEVEGAWITQAAGRSIQVDYRSVSNRSAFVETWRTSSGRETMTVFFMNGRTMLATHYCGQGNQPTLALMESAPGRWKFRLSTATGVDPGESVLTVLLLEKTQSGLRRTETYRLNGKDETRVFDFRKSQAAVSIPRSPSFR